jgi:hypothetical protein
MFMLYVDGEDGRECHFVKNVRLGGLLCDHLSQQALVNKPDTTDCMSWEMSRDDLRRAVLAKFLVGEKSQPVERYRVIVDATYGRSDALLLEICHVWGYSHPKWSPVLLRLCVLYDENRPDGPSTPLRRFELDPGCTAATEFVHEFLYLQWGHQRGTQKNWGRVGYTNAALLWPKHLEHLLGKIGFTRAN